MLNTERNLPRHASATGESEARPVRAFCGHQVRRQTRRRGTACIDRWLGVGIRNYLCLQGRWQLRQRLGRRSLWRGVINRWKIECGFGCRLNRRRSRICPFNLSRCFPDDRAEFRNRVVVAFFGGVHLRCQSAQLGFDRIRGVGSFAFALFGTHSDIHDRAFDRLQTIVDGRVVQPVFEARQSRFQPRQRGGASRFRGNELARVIADHLR